MVRCPCARRSSAARSATRSRRCGRRCRSGSRTRRSACKDQRRDGGSEEVGQAVGAQVLTNLAGFAPPTILSQAARLQARQQFFNLVVTNVPGPQFPAVPARPPAGSALSGRPAGPAPGARDRRHELRRAPRLRPARRLRRLPKLDAIAEDLKWAIASLDRAAGVKPAASAREQSRARQRPRPHEREAHSS